VQGQKILWNINSSWWSQKIIQSSFELLKPGAQGDGREFRGTVTRIYPHLVDASDRTRQLFKELINVSFPAFLKTQAWLTFRFASADEDGFWIHSAALGRTRELTGSNRTDALLRSTFSPDDLLIWSGNQALVDPRLERTLVALVPFAALDTMLLQAPQKSCESVKTAGEPPAWNYQNRRFPNAAPWLRTDWIFVPRRLYRLELSSRDPYSLYGRQTLYVDSAMMLPVAKIVYDRAGRHWKTVLGTYSLAVSEDRRRKMPVHTSAVSVDVLRDQAYGMNFPNTTYCQSFHEKLQPADLDPRRLGPAAPPAASPAPQPTSTSAPAAEPED